MATRVRQALDDFEEVAKRQTKIVASTKWIHFGGSRPSLVPEGTLGSTKDLIIYDNVSAIVDDGGQHAQVPIGTLIQVAKTWKLIDLPATLLDAETASGYFFRASMEVRPDLTASDTAWK